MKNKSIIIIDDELVIPSLIKELLEGECPQLQISEMVTDKDKFLDLVSKNPFDAALIDISISGREGGIDLLCALKKQGSLLPVIMLSAHDEGTYAAKCLGLGAAGYISKTRISSDLVPGLKKVLNGELFVSGHEGESILKKFREAIDGSVLK